jgi:hypothetical protein
VDGGVNVTVVESAGVARQFFASRSFRLLLLASITIGALLLGLVGMHALSAAAEDPGGHGSHSQMTPSLSSNGPMSAASADSTPSATQSFSSFGSAVGFTGPSCSGMCEMNCLLLGMVCALSLLVALIGLVLSKRPSPPVSQIRRAARIPRIDASVFVLPIAPSLHALSISRT